MAQIVFRAGERARRVSGRRNHTPLWCTGLWKQNFVSINDACLQPAAYQPLDRLDGIELFEQGVSVDFVKALFDVCLRHTWA